MSERQAKREKFSDKQGTGRKMLVPVLVIAAAVAAVLGGWLMTGKTVAGGPEVVSAGQDGMVRFAAADYSDGKARFYRFNGQAGSIDFFVVKSDDGVIRSAFDTCDVCYKARKGYRQEGHEMVCNNCDQRFPTDKVNEVKGGCNPAPLLRQQVGETIAIAAADIERGAWYFKGAAN
jgi:uncharacterized membrane protein